MSTTARLVMYHSRMGTLIHVGKDLGPYPGTKPELNVRKLCTIETFEGLTITSPAVRTIMDRDEGYGCGWGDTSSLYPVSDADVESLRAAARPATVAGPADAPSAAHEWVKWAEAARPITTPGFSAAAESGEGVWWRYNQFGERELMEDC